MKYLKYLALLVLLIPINVFAYSKSVVDITNMSIEELSYALDKGYITSELLVELYLERIEEYDDEFNSIREINENALEEAKKLDKERENSNVRSVLHGIPIVVKTNIDVKGLATTAGAKTLKDNYPNEDGYAVAKLKEAGAIILGSTNMSEFAFLAKDSYSSYGHVKNAFNTSYSPYGSSGGSAVAIATSFAAASLGTDTNSSVRVPASAAGLVGLRPSLGLISRSGVIPYDLERDTIGILTKTANDNALILSVIAGTDENDSKTTDAIVKDYNIKSENKLKIGVVNSYLEGASNKTSVNSKTDFDIAELAKSKINLLESAGYEVVYIEELLSNYYISLAKNTMSGDSFCDGFNKYIKRTTGTIRSFKDLAYSSGHVYSITGYLGSCNEKWLYDKDIVATRKETFENHILEVMKENNIDIIVYPTTKNKTLKLNENGLISPGSMLGSVIGYPSITIPMGYIDEFPYSLEFFSTKYNEDKLYEIARDFEKLVNLDLVNSPLTPSLYEIPEYIEELKEIYENHYEEKKYEELTNKTKEYFRSYNETSNEENEINANNLIKEYKKLENINYHNNWLLIIVIIILTIVLTNIMFNIKNKIAKLSATLKKKKCKYKK